MKCTVSLFTILTIMLLTFILLTEIKCCSNNPNDIISIMSEPDFQRNPCYIQWKAEQDKRKAEILRPRQMEQQNWENRFRKTIAENIIKEARTKVSAGMIFAIIVGIICAICCCTVCYSVTQNDDDSADGTTTTITRTTTTTTTTEGVTGVTVISTSRSVATSSFGNQRATDLSSATSANANLTAFNVDVRSSPSTIRSTPRQQQETNVPLLPRGVINRQDSLPSYEDAVKMPSASPRY